jgi:GT2 family glycosyltransferase
MPAATDGLESTIGPHVTVVLVSHNGAKWLPQVLDGLERQRRMPNALVAVDTGSRDESVDVLAARLGTRSVCRIRRSVGFGAAVAAGLEHIDGEPVEPRRHAPANRADPSRSWIWLLHDDSAPAPNALAALLTQVRDDVAVVGPKLREWPSLRRLLEVGATISGTGQRETGLERGEPDQGQHDRPRDVLAVNTAGMLIRRDVWNQLGGLEHQLPVFGADIDIGWRVARAGYRTRTAPDAVVFHLEAASRGLRSDVGRSRPHAQQRRAAIFTLLANASWLGFWWQSIRLLIGSVLRSIGFLLAKAPREAVDELRGAAGVYLHPFAMLRARHRRRRQARRSPRDVRPLLPSPLLPYRHGVDAVLDIGLAVIRATGGSAQPQISGKRAVIESGPVAAEAEELPTATSTVSRLLRQSWMGIALVLVLLSLWAARDLLGEGQLLGGALLPAPDGIGGWWGLIWESWHPVGLGSGAAAAPYVSVLALAGAATFGQPWLLIDLLVLAAVPLSALTASRLAGRIFVSRRVRIWWCLTYAALPILTGAVAQGRIGTLVGLVVLPVVATAAIRFFDEADPLWLSALRLGLWTSLLVAFVPVGYWVVGAGLVLAAMALPPGRAGRRPTLLGVAAAMGLPWLLLTGWMWDRVLDPSAVWWEAGLVDATVDGRPLDLAPGPLDLAGGVPGGVGTGPALLGLVVVALGVVALGRTDRMRLVATAWLVALVGLGLAVVGAGQRIDVEVGTPSAAVWVGFPLACWLAGLAVAAGLAADRVSDFLAGRSFGWRQPVAVGASAVAALVPLAVAVWWVIDDDTALRRADPVPVPVYLAAQASGPEQSATLVLSGSTADGVGYEIVRDDGTRLGEETVLPERSEVERMDRAVADLLTTPDTATVSALLDQGIGAVYASPPVDATVASALDGAAGLTRAGTTDPEARAWQAVAPSGAARLVPVADGSVNADRAIVLNAPPSLTGSIDIPPGTGPRQLHLAAGASDRWSATGSGGPLEAVTTGSGTQAFTSPDGGQATVSYDSSHRRWLLLHLAIAVVAVVIALPGRRRQP